MTSKMTEAPFSVNWRMINPDGEAEQFTVRGEELVAFLEARDKLQDALIEKGLAFLAPPPQRQVQPAQPVVTLLAGSQPAQSASDMWGPFEDGSKIESISGFILGEKASDGTPAVFLYTNNRPYAAMTLYPEDAHLFPFKYPGLEDIEWQGGAPDKSKGARKLHACNFKLPCIPKLDKDTKEPIKNEKGYVIYRTDRWGKSVAAQKLAAEASPFVPSVQAQPAAAEMKETLVYKHKRPIPTADYSQDMIGDVLGDDADMAFAGDLSPAMLDVVNYARGHIRYGKGSMTSTAATGARLWNDIMAALYAKVQLITKQGKLAMDVVARYVGLLLVDEAITSADDTPKGVTVFLAECLMEKDGLGNANTRHDPEWVEAFANVVAAAITLDMEESIPGYEGGDTDDDNPFLS